MNRHVMTLAVTALAGVAVLASCPAQADALAGVSGRAGGWGKAEEVPGTAGLNRGFAHAYSVSCPAVDSCSVSGSYTDSSGNLHAFVASRGHDGWGEAMDIPGLAGMGLSCPSTGNCGAAGYSTDSSGHQQAFVVSQSDGAWGTPEEVPGIAALGQGSAAVSLSCPSAGNCSTAGTYREGSGQQEFVDSQVDGTWGRAAAMPGIAALNQGGYAMTSAVSCGSAGNCAAGGVYTDRSLHLHAFVISQVRGTWGRAEQPRGIAALNRDDSAQLAALSCASAGNCSAGGVYADSSGRTQPFVVSQVRGAWGRAEEVPGIAALNMGSDAEVTSVSCASAGNCSAGGLYTDSSGHTRAFGVSQVHGAWGKAIAIPGTPALDQAATATILSLSCGSAGNCSAGGAYTDNAGNPHAFVASQVHGTWGAAQQVPGLPALNKGDNAQISDVSCGSARNCAAAGYYTDSSGHTQAFVVSRT